MPFPFTLPTTSSLSFPDFFSSPSHPSLLLTATTYRGVLRDALKKHKRLNTQAQAANLPQVLAAINDYLPYLHALSTGASGQGSIGNEEIRVESTKALSIEWRPTLSATLPGREVGRVKITSLNEEIAFVLSTYAYIQSLMARSQLRSLYAAASPTAEQRVSAISTAMKHLVTAHSVHRWVQEHLHNYSGPVDISTPVATALASLALADATLIAVYKDDPYPAAVAEDRNKASKDWMFKAPTIPKVRAHLFARLCLAAAEHAAKAEGALGSVRGKVDDDLVRYVEDLRRTARAKACRFLAIDSDLAGNVGEGIAWLRAAQIEMGILRAGEGAEKAKGFSKFKKEWAEKREDKRIEKGGEWGADAGKMEESRVVEMLEAKWAKQNDTINCHTIPPSEPLLARLPTGRECHNPQPYVMPTLDVGVLQRMRAPVEPAATGFTGDEDDSGDERQGYGSPVGAFPGTQREYSDSTYF